VRSGGSESCAHCAEIDNLAMLEHTGRLMPDRHLGPTRLVRAAVLSTPDRDLYLKLESELPTGSFKVRGAVHSLSVNLAKGGIRAVVAASTGNHGAAVAYAGRLLDVPAIIFLPANPNAVKAARIRDLGATLVETGPDLNAAIDAAREHASSRSHAFFLHDAEDPDIPAGTATIGQEVLSQLPSVEAIYVPMGDTALIRGVASAAKQLRPTIRIIGVVAEQAPAYYLSWQKGETVETDSANTIADGLAVRRPLAPNVAAIRELVDDIEAVSERAMLEAIGRLHKDERVTAEPAGAAATAAWLKRRDSYRTSVVLVTGRNITPDVMEMVRSVRL
jgi:threonine dehydratase